MGKSFARNTPPYPFPTRPSSLPRQYNQPHAATSTFASQSQRQPSLAPPSRIKQARRYGINAYRGEDDAPEQSALPSSQNFITTTCDKTAALLRRSQRRRASVSLSSYL